MDLARTQAAADALGNMRAEHLQPSDTVAALLARWARGELSTDQLTAARRLIAAGEDMNALLAPPTLSLDVGRGRRPAAGNRYPARMSQPELERQVSQHRGDIDALYELVERVDHKVDALDVKVDALSGRVDALDAKLDNRFDQLSGQLAEVLRQLRAQ